MNNKTAGLKIMATNWGFTGTMDQFCAKAKQSSYDGVELWWPLDKSKQDEMFAAVKKHGLELGFLCGGGQGNPSAHLDFYKKMIDAAAKQTIQRPLYINSHSGKDYFTIEENGKFIDYTEKLAKETDLLICHETHRGRMLYAGPVTKEYLRRHPSLKLTLDISHWCCVHESMLGDQQETVNLALERVEHIHARIGHPEGPQVNDPRAPEWAKIVEQHLKWWDVVVARKKKKGETVTFLTEFGPPDYLPTMPYTKMPLADLWEVNTYMMQLLRKRYS
ncbi:sugar phosphate isomerase/epimerase family protein [Niabella terrae]